MKTIRSLLGRAATIVLLDGESEFADALNAALYFNDDLKLVESTTDPGELRVLLARHSPDAVLISHALPKESGLAVAGRIVKEVRDARVVLMTGTPTRQLLTETASRGIRRVVSRPPNLQRRTLDEWVESELVPAVYGMIDDEPRPIALAGRRDNKPRRPLFNPAAASVGARVIAVWSPKGGVGKSTIAANLALYSQTNDIFPAQTALVGLDSGTGVLSSLLAMTQRPTLLDWPEHGEGSALEPSAVLERIARHESQLRVVFEPEVQDGPEVSPDLVRAVVRSVRDAAGSSLVVLDCESRVIGSGTTTAALSLAHIILLVVEPTFSCLRYVGSFVSVLAKKGLIEPSKIRVVVNRQPAKPNLPPSEIVARLQFPLVGVIQDDPTVGVAINRGHAPAIRAPNGLFMKGIKEVAFKVIPGLGEAQAKLRGRRKVMGLF